MNPHSDAVDAPVRSLSVDLPSVAAQVERSLHGEVSRTRIDALLRELLEHDFGDARVLAYLPILMQRRACELLQAERRLGVPEGR